MKCSGVQSGLALQMLKRKLRSRFRALARVVDLGMELHRPDVALGVGDAGDGVGCFGGQMEAGRKLERFVAVGHPDMQMDGQSGKERRLPDRRPRLRRGRIRACRRSGPCPPR